MLEMHLAIIDSADDKCLFERLYNKYKSMMYNVAYGILYDFQLSEDAVHDAFLSVARNINKISDEECIQARNFLIIIVRNAALKIYNKNKNEISVDDSFSDIPDLQSLDIDVENNESQQSMLRLIKEMDNKHSDVLILKYFYDYRDKEISSMLGISLENVKIRLHRGKALLKKKLSEVDYDRQSI